MSHLVRIDIDNPTGKSPMLVGLAMKGFGWLLGGSGEGDITIAIDCDGNWTPFETSSTTQDQVDKFRRRVENFDYVRNGRKNWQTT